MKHSKSTGFWYNPAIHKIIPDDAIDVADELYNKCVRDRPDDKVIDFGEDGMPYLADPAAPTDKQRAATIRAERDALMAAFQWRLDRYASELRMGLAPTDDIALLDAYMQALRDVTKQSTFPASVNWPAVPA